MKRNKFTVRGAGVMTAICASLLLGSMALSAYAGDSSAIGPGAAVSPDIAISPAAAGGSSAITGGGSSAVVESGIIMTGFSLLNSDGSVFTGKLKEGEVVQLVLNLFDDRTEAGYIPNVRLDTGSFTIPGQSSIVCKPATLSADGRYSVTFNNLTYTGKGNTFSCKIFYTMKNAAGQIVNSDLAVVPLSIDINQAVPTVDAPPVEPPPVVTKGTGFVMKSASYGQESLYAGNGFTLSATMLTTNGDNSVENVTVSVTPPKDISLLSGSSILYIGSVAPGKSFPVSFSLRPMGNIAEGSYDINLAVSGVNEKTGEQVSAQMTVTVPILQPERFEIFNTQIPTSLTVGMEDGSGFAELTLVNQGQGAVSNVSVEIKGDGLSTQEGRLFIGNVASGEQKTADFTLMAEKAGRLDGQAVISYENTRGDKKELTYDFSVEAMEGLPPDMGGGMKPPDIGGGGDIGAGGSGLPPWLIPVIIAAACVAAVFFIVRQVRKKRAKAAEQYLLDYDDDHEEDHKWE